jgi:Domain of unknown function (DUF222)
MGWDRDSISAAYDALDTAFETVAALSYDTLDTAATLRYQDRLELLRRRLPATEHQLLAHAQTLTTPKEIGAKSWADVLAIRLRISGTEATRRVKEAEDLGPRTALTGAPLPPRLPETAAAQARGDINAEHVAIIRQCLKDTARFIDAAARAEIDHDLARDAVANSPETLREAAKLLVYLFNQDGDAPDDEHRARRREVNLGRQDADGMSPFSGWLDPEMAASIQALFAKLAAPGMCNPNDETPTVDGEPDTDTVDADDRTLAQRQHDALKAICRNTLSSGELGQHNGLPVTVVVSTTLQDLHAAAGVAVTGSGSLLPISDVIRMASHARHYLVIYDKHTREPLYLGRTKRIASPGQRLVLINRDRGCTRPGCTAPADRCQAHHAAQDFGNGGQTNITDLGLACGPDNRLVKEGGWSTRIRSDGRIEWIPPPLLDTGQDRINHHHHPNELLRPPEERPPEDRGEDHPPAA